MPVEEETNTSLGMTEADAEFFMAMNAYRRAKDSGDKQAIAEAEEHLRNTVRAELAGRV